MKKLYASARERNQASYMRRGEKVRAGALARYHKDPRKSKDEFLRRLYGISIDDYEAILEAQGGVCLICSEPPTVRGRKRHLEVDHNHSNGQVRGLLCNKCNTGIGGLRDDPTMLKRAILYLEVFDGSRRIPGL